MRGSRARDERAQRQARRCGLRLGQRVRALIERDEQIEPAAAPPLRQDDPDCARLGRNRPPPTDSADVPPGSSSWGSTPAGRQRQRPRARQPIVTVPNLTGTGRPFAASKTTAVLVESA
jgi:hypothetical protein